MGTNLQSPCMHEHHHRSRTVDYNSFQLDRPIPQPVVR
jgi:hypothetical protein